MSANIAVFREMSVNLLISRKCWKYQGKISGFVREKYFVKNKTWVHMLCSSIKVAECL